jgi:uncharacterized membrane protein YgcG
MMRFTIRALLAGGLGLSTSLLVACGGTSGLLSGGQASNLNNSLDNVSSAVSAGQCGPAQSAVNSFNNQLAGLPASVNATLRANLLQGANVVGRNAAQDCLNPVSTTPKTTTNTTPTNTTQSTATTTPTQIVTTPATTTTPPPPPPVTTPPATTSTPTGTSSTGNSGGAGIGGGSGGGGSSGGAGAVNPNG